MFVFFYSFFFCFECHIHIVYTNFIFSFSLSLSFLFLCIYYLFFNFKSINNETIKVGLKTLASVLEIFSRHAHVKNTTYSVVVKRKTSDKKTDNKEGQSTMNTTSQSTSSSTKEKEKTKDQLTINSKSSISLTINSKMESPLQMESIDNDRNSNDRNSDDRNSKRNSKRNSVSGKRPVSPILSGKLSLATIEDVSNDIHKMKEDVKDNVKDKEQEKEQEEENGSPKKRQKKDGNDIQRNNQIIDQLQLVTDEITSNQYEETQYSPSSGSTSSTSSSSSSSSSSSGSFPAVPKINYRLQPSLLPPNQTTATTAISTNEVESIESDAVAVVTNLKKRSITSSTSSSSSSSKFKMQKVDSNNLQKSKTDTSKFAGRWLNYPKTSSTPFTMDFPVPTYTAKILLSKKTEWLNQMNGFDASKDMSRLDFDGMVRFVNNIRFANGGDDTFSLCLCNMFEHNCSSCRKTNTKTYKHDRVYEPESFLAPKTPGKITQEYRNGSMQSIEPRTNRKNGWTPQIKFNHPAIKKQLTTGSCDYFNKQLKQLIVFLQLYGGSTLNIKMKKQQKSLQPSKISIHSFVQAKKGLVSFGLDSSYYINEWAPKLVSGFLERLGKERASRMEHCSFNFYSFYLLQTCFIVFVNDLFYLKHPSKSFLTQ